ncbi:hypothetical protein [Corynebacterium sp.]|uniref:hypothetical protein n=1 Tax=Corynebacterium sp. TaxID=1720 RepID=UPI0026DB23D4|nr:hypothetical protein [Corynebacterium sp.]MDO5076303.1 hypothetical protein [Corynebacterium sp.]
MSNSEFRPTEILSRKPDRDTVIDLAETGADSRTSSALEVASSSYEAVTSISGNTTTQHHITAAPQQPKMGTMTAFQTMASFYQAEQGKRRGTAIVQLLLFAITFFLFSSNFTYFGAFFGGPDPAPPFAITITIMALFVGISAYLKATASRAETKIKSTLNKLRPSHTNANSEQLEHPAHYVKNAAQYVVTFSKVDSTLRFLQHTLVHALTVLSAVWTVFAWLSPASRFESIAFALTCILVGGIIQVILSMDFFGYDDDVQKLLRTIENDSKYAALLQWAKIPTEDNEQRKVVQISNADYEELPASLSLNLPRFVLMYGLAAFFTAVLNMVFAERLLTQPISDVFTLTIITSLISIPIMASTLTRMRFPLQLRQRYILHHRPVLIALFIAATLLFIVPVLAMSEVLSTEYNVRPPVNLMIMQIVITLIIPVGLGILESTRYAHAANQILRGTMTPYTTSMTLPWRAKRPIRLSTISRRFLEDVLTLKKQLQEHIVDKEMTMRPLIS